MSEPGQTSRQETLALLTKNLGRLSTGDYSSAEHRRSIAKDAVSYCKALMALLEPHTRG